MQEILSRKDASERGLARYYTGAACKREHTVERYTASGNCVKCAAEAAGSYGRVIKAARRNYVQIKALVHTEDAPAIERFIATLATARELSTPPIKPPTR